MRYSSMFALPAVLSLMTLTTASTLPSHYRRSLLPEQAFTCPGSQSVSLCCSSQIKANGGVEDCEKSLHFIIRAAGDHSYLANSIHTCSADQLSRGYDRPVCCRSQFMPTLTSRDVHGMNCAAGHVDHDPSWRSNPNKIPTAMQTPTDNVPLLPATDSS